MRRVRLEGTTFKQGEKWGVTIEVIPPEGESMHYECKTLFGTYEEARASMKDVINQIAQTFEREGGKVLSKEEIHLQ